MQLETADHKYTNVMEPICIREDVTVPLNDRQSGRMASGQNCMKILVTGIFQPSNTLTDDGDIAFCAALVTLTNGQVWVHLNNFTDSPSTLKSGTQDANFTVLTLEQLKHVKPIDPVTTWHLLQDNPENAAHYASSLIKSTKSEDFKKNLSFFTPEDPGDPQHHIPIQIRILPELHILQELEKPNSQDIPESRQQFLGNFD